MPAGACDAPRDGLRVTGLEPRDVRRNFDGVGANRRRPLLIRVEQDHRDRRTRRGDVVDVVPAELSNKYWPLGVEPKTTDACVAAACANLRLTSLALDELHLLTSSIVDGITRSQTAATLECLHIGYSAQGLESPLRAADLLRIIQGCPKLADLNWFCDQGGRSRAGLDREPCQAIVDLMKSRGTTMAHCTGVQDCIVQFAVVGEYGNCYGQNPSLES